MGYQDQTWVGNTFVPAAAWQIFFPQGIHPIHCTILSPVPWDLNNQMRMCFSFFPFRFTLSSSKNKKHSKNNFTCVVCHPKEDCIATGHKDGKIRLWWVNSWRVLWSVPYRFIRAIQNMASTKSGKRMVPKSHYSQQKWALLSSFLWVLYITLTWCSTLGLLRLVGLENFFLPIKNWTDGREW